MSKNNGLTYGALGAQIAEFGTAFKANGIGRTANVAVMLPDGPHLAVALVATVCHAVAVPINPKLTAIELDDLFAVLRVDAMVTSSRVTSEVSDLAARYGVRLLKTIISGPGTFKISTEQTIALPARRGAEVVPRNAKPEDLAFILRTSATTGRPKLVPVNSSKSRGYG